MTLREFLVYAPREFLRPFVDDNGDLIIDEVTLNKILEASCAKINTIFSEMDQEQRKELIVYETLSRLLLRQGQFELANQLVTFVTNKVQAYASAKSKQTTGLIVKSDERILSREEFEKW